MAFPYREEPRAWRRRLVSGVLIAVTARFTGDPHRGQAGSW